MRSNRRSNQIKFRKKLYSKTFILYLPSGETDTPVQHDVPFNADIPVDLQICSGNFIQNDLYVCNARLI
jgi:hypothetical protein